MKAMRIHQFGGPEVLAYEDVPVPDPGPGQVIIKLHAASVNPVDTKIASGVYRTFMPIDFPWTPGRDFSGVVESLGPGVAHLKVGDPVFGDSRPAGAYAQFILVDTLSLVPKPSALSHAQAASLPIAALTAWQGLFDHAKLQPGQTVLIHAAAGGVGSFAVQLAHWKGAHVVATASIANRDYLRGLGADKVIDYRDTPFETAVHDVDVVFDLAGGDVTERSFKVLKPGGFLICAVAPPSEELMARYKVRAVRMMVQPTNAGLLQILDLVKRGLLKTLVSKTYPLAEARAAWSDILAHHTRGKLVLDIPE